MCTLFLIWEPKPPGTLRACSGPYKDFTYIPEVLYWKVYFISLHLMYSRWLQLYLLPLYSVNAVIHKIRHGFVLRKAELRISEVRACKCYIMKRIRDSSVSTVTRLGDGYPGIRL
jgi:hypothetical protein